jgi:ADP-heptose:LPS heptosyltransferase
MNASNSPRSTSLLPILLLKNYLHFLSRRPISGSNLHFKAGRIASLQTLAPLLSPNPGDDLEQCIAMLRTLTTTNLARFAPQILRLLQRYKEPLLPRHIVSSTAQPPASFFTGVQRALLILGQGIGIGDEILTFPLATTLRGRMPADAKLTVLSSYRDLWRDVPGVDSQSLYDGLGEVVEAIREGGYGLVVMVDFERPGLLSTLCREPAVTHYIELAMGLRELSVLDKTEDRVWKLEHPDPYDANFYHHMERMRLWLGDSQQPAKALPVAFAKQGPREIVVYASPFTSKEDPSQQFWFELLISMLQEEPSAGLTVSIHIDSGANCATRAFALELAKSIDNSGRPGVSAKAASTIGLAGSLLSLADAMQRIASADIIVTSDSFPAHAGQLYGKLTLVLARDGVESWRAPAPGNFYLRAGAPIAELIGQARVLLGDLAHLHTVESSIASSPALSALRSSARSLHRTLHQTGAQPDDETLRSQWTSAHQATLAVLAESATWPSGYSILRADNEYDGLLPPYPPTEINSSASLLHMRCRVAEWCNSNLLKYALWPGLEGESA